MKMLTIFTILLVFIWSGSADEEASTLSNESSNESLRESSKEALHESFKKSLHESSEELFHESPLTFYSCVACGSDEVITAYQKCRELKTENTKNITEECVARILPEGEREGDKRWEYFCQHPEDIAKVYECSQEYLETLTDEDQDALQKFKECTEDVDEEYCEGQSDVSTNFDLH